MCPHHVYHVNIHVDNFLFFFCKSFFPPAKNFRGLGKPIQMDGGEITCTRDTQEEGCFKRMPTLTGEETSLLKWSDQRCRIARES